MTIQGDVKTYNEIGAINGYFGPFYRISFDLIIHSYVEEISSVLSFGRSWYIAIFFNENGELKFYFTIHRRYSFVLNVKLSKWYNITIVAKPIDNKKVRKKIQLFGCVDFKFLGRDLVLGLYHCYNRWKRGSQS